jgi:predicted aldo/keto reductase-like oxidoreductase
MNGVLKKQCKYKWNKKEEFIVQFRKFGKYNKKVSVLGFGCMRLPVMPDGSINEKEAITQLRKAIDNGVNYLDTAFIYHEGKSEVVLGKALKDGYREKTYIADKMPLWNVKTYEDFDRILNEQLERLDVEYIDFYLLHALDKNLWDKCKKLDAIKFLENAQKCGKIKHIGFSFHDDIGTFKGIVDYYNWDFCQIQYNYMDEDNQAGIEGLHYAANKNMAVIVMEPLLGGKLAIAPPTEVQQLWDCSETKRTPAEWGLSWIWNQPEVTVILSGMNSMGQLDENIKTASEVLPDSLTDSEKELIKKVRSKFKELTKVSCTGCRYCITCPKDIDIPRIFALHNEAAVYNNIRNCSYVYSHEINTKNNATACVECGKCEKVCPQHLKIKQHLKDAHEFLFKADAQ